MSEAAAQIECLLRRRGAGKTICPSEVARVLAGENSDWRGRMEEVHGAVDDMIATNRIALSWKGESLSCREGPYRIGMPE